MRPGVAEEISGSHKCCCVEVAIQAALDCAINAFTYQNFVRTLAGRMRGPSKRIPRYFQVLLEVKYKGGVPTETSYLLHRELRRRN